MRKIVTQEENRTTIKVGYFYRLMAGNLVAMPSKMSTWHLDTLLTCKVRVYRGAVFRLNVCVCVWGGGEGVSR